MLPHTVQGKEATATGKYDPKLCSPLNKSYYFKDHYDTVDI